MDGWIVGHICNIPKLPQLVSEPKDQMNSNTEKKSLQKILQKKHFRLHRIQNHSTKTNLVVKNNNYISDHLMKNLTYFGYVYYDFNLQNLVESNIDIIDKLKLKELYLYKKVGILEIELKKKKTLEWERNGEIKVVSYTENGHSL